MGVMAHELSHVLLRHGTAQASKAGTQMGQVAGAVLGAIIGGRVGSAVGQCTQFGLGTAFLRFGRDANAADILGAQLMARAGYDPRDMASMFRTIEKQGGLNGPGSGSAIIRTLGTGPISSKGSAVPQGVEPGVGSFRVRSGEVSPEIVTAGAIVGGGGKGEQRPHRRREGSRPSGTLGPVQPPSSRYREYSEGDLFRISVPTNWRELPVVGGHVRADRRIRTGRQPERLHSRREVGVSRNERHDLPKRPAISSRSSPSQRTAVAAVRFAERDHRWPACPANRTREHLGRDRQGGGDPALHDEASRRHTLLRPRVALPEQEYPAYEATFQQVVRSIKLND